MNRNEIITLDFAKENLLSFLNEARSKNGMINKRCPNKDCGSTSTYAVPSRAVIRTNPDGSVIFKADGTPDKIMCRRCRGCGEDYLDDSSKVVPKAPRNDSELGAHVRKLMEDRGIEVK